MLAAHAPLTPLRTASPHTPPGMLAGGDRSPTPLALRGASGSLPPGWAASTGGTQWPPKPLQPLHVPSPSPRTQPSCPQVLPLSSVTVWCAAGQRCTTFAFPEFLIGNPCAPRSLSCYFFLFFPLQCFAFPVSLLQMQLTCGLCVAIYNLFLGRVD